jgi:hypothetical protein
MRRQSFEHERVTRLRAEVNWFEMHATVKKNYYLKSHTLGRRKDQVIVMEVRMKAADKFHLYS